MPAIIIGSKARPESEVDRGVTRAVLGAGFSLLRRLILHTRVGDSQGTLLVNGELLRRLVPHLLETGFLFTTELVYVAERLGLRPLEVPVRLELDHRDHPSRVSVSDIASMAIGLIRIRRRHGSRPLRMAPGA